MRKRDVIVGANCQLANSMATRLTVEPKKEIFLRANA